MNPAIVLGVVQFVWGLAGKKPPDVSWILIENQMKILQGLNVIADQLETIQIKLNEIEKLVLSLPSDNEIYETAAEIRSAISRIGDIYIILDKKIKNETLIDFTKLISDINHEYQISIDLLTHAESIISDDNSHNSLVYAVLTLDSILFTLSTHLIYPDELYHNIKFQTDKLENPVFDSQIAIEEFQTSQVDRIIRIYSEADKVISSQINEIFRSILPMCDSQNMAHTLDYTAKPEEFDKMQNLLVKGYKDYAERIHDGGSDYGSNSLQLHHHLVLKVTRPFDLTNLSGPSGRFIKLYIYKGAAMFFSDGKYLEFAPSTIWPIWRVKVGRFATIEDSLKEHNINLREPTYEEIIGPATIPPESVPGVIEKLAEYDNEIIPIEYQAVRDQAIQFAQALFYKGTLRYILKDRSDYLTILRSRQDASERNYADRITVAATHRSFFANFLKGFYKGYKTVTKLFDVKDQMDEAKFNNLIKLSSSQYLSENHPDFVNLKNGHVSAVVVQAVMFINTEDVLIDEFGKPYHESKLKFRYVGAGTSVGSAVYLKAVENEEYFDNEMWSDLTGEFGDDVEVQDQAFIEVTQNEYADEFNAKVDFDTESPVQSAKSKIKLLEGLTKVPSMDGRLRTLVKARNEYEGSLLASVSSSEKVELLKLIRDKEILVSNLESSVANYERYRKEVAAAQGAQMVGFLLSAASLIVNSVEAADQDLKNGEMQAAYDNLNSQLEVVKSDALLADQKIDELNAKIKEFEKTPAVMNKFNIIIYSGPGDHKNVFLPPQ